MDDAYVPLAAILGLTIVGVAYLWETNMYSQSIMVAILGAIAGLGTYTLKEQ